MRILKEIKKYKNMKNDYEKNKVETKKEMN